MLPKTSSVHMSLFLYLFFLFIRGLLLHSSLCFCFSIYSCPNVTINGHFTEWFQCFNVSQWCISLSPLCVYMFLHFISIFWLRVSTFFLCLSFCHAYGMTVQEMWLKRLFQDYRSKRNGNESHQWKMILQAGTSKNKDEEITMKQGKEKWDETWLRNFLPILDKLKWNTIECFLILVSLIWMKESFYSLL